MDLKNNRMVQIKGFLKWMIKRNGVVYILFGFILLNVIDFQKVKDRRIIESINEVMPSFDRLRQFHDGGESLSINDIDEYLTYYNKIYTISPRNAELNSFLGFFNYYKGYEKKAIFHFKKAIILNPTQFWYRYDLGVIYYRMEDYSMAVSLFTEARNSNFELSVTHIYSSPFYRRMVYKISNIGEVIEKNLMKSYNDIYVLESLAYYQLEEFQKMGDVSREALARKAGNRAFHSYHAGLAAYHRKDLEISLFYLNQCMQEKPKFAEVYYYLSSVWKDLGDKKKAFSFLQTSVTLHENQLSVSLVDVNKIQLRLF